ncbi:macrophage mannose receptor 1-like isoform X2 [Ptychodera flava]
MNTVLAILVIFAFPLVYGQSATFHRCECYLYTPTCGALTWDEAKAACESNGGWLATMDTEDIWRTLKNEVIAAGMNKKKCHQNGLWIGYYDPDDSIVVTGHDTSVFKWVHPMCKKFEQWEDKQPDDKTKKSDYGQNCVQLWIRKNNKYDDDYCTNKKGYICQRQLDNCSCT